MKLGFSTVYNALIVHALPSLQYQIVFVFVCFYFLARANTLLLNLDKNAKSYKIRELAM